MEEMRQIVIAMLAVGGIGTAAVAAQEIVQAVAERRRRARRSRWCAVRCWTRTKTHRSKKAAAILTIP